MTEHRPSAVELALRELREALAARGITLPSLGLDAVTAPDVCTYTLVELGRCNVETARRLAAALREGLR
ncbi:hypothetical protein [Streptomyces litchfieldiae]|uniref:Uncharacterized protein n=1 Tax=Streptomyces litchfieldiae TaxID=3075543 RepID=A0ABU2MNT0_9ACTN|nr:hypothetical protein [Streptomyces sp. DSM 44938]MDT0343281.1 hypothetical protein [Streptomyces sp. DSM 44938]